VFLEVPWLVARVVPPEISLGILRRRYRRTRQKAPAQRAEGDETDPQLPDDGNQPLLQVPLPEGVLALKGGDGVDGVSSPKRRLARLRKAEEAHLSRRDEVGHRSYRVLDRDLGIDPVLVEQVDMIHPQATQGAVHCFADARWMAVELHRFSILDSPAESRGDDYLVAATLERTAQQLLVRVRAVDFGGVEEVDAELERPVDGGNGLALVTVGGRSVRLAHSHAAKADRRYGKADASQRSLLAHLHPPGGRPPVGGGWIRNL